MAPTRQYLAGTCLLAFLIAAPLGYLFLHPRSEARPPEQPTGKTGAGTSWPMFGGTPQRNMVDLIDKNITATWNAEEGKRKNIKWIANVGDKAYGGPIVADGKVFVGTNNGNPRDPNVKDKNRPILMAFNEADGKFLWQIVHETPDEEIFKEARPFGLFSTPTVEEKRIYYVTPACQVVCADTDGKVKWTYDMMKELKVVPYHAGNCSPVINGDLVLLVTSNGVDDEGKVPSAKAPSFIAVNKNTGKLVWQSSLPGENIIEGQWSNPTIAIVDGKTQAIFPGGDCVLYSLEPQTGALLWKCDCNPTRKKKGGREIENYIVATPVVQGNRLYIGLGPYPGHPNRPRYGYVLCIDITKKGDVSPKNYDAQAPANKDSALVWAFGGVVDPPPAKGRQIHFGVTTSTAAIVDGLVYITEEAGYVHCLDAKTGKSYWNHDLKATVAGNSPYYVDGKVYVGTEDGDVVIFEHGKVRKYFLEGKAAIPSKENDKKLPSASMDEPDAGTPVVASGVLYILTKSKLFAIK